MMSRALRVLLSLLLAAPAGAVVVEPALPALPASAVASAFSGGAAAALTRAAGGLSLRSPALALSSLDALSARAASIQSAPAAAAYSAALAVLAAPTSATPERLRQAGVPAAAAKRLAAVSGKIDAQAARDPAFAARAASSRAAAARAAQSLLSRARPRLSENLAATLQQFLDWGQAESGDQPESPDSHGPVVSPSAGSGILNPKTRPTVTFGAAVLPVIALPTVGDDIFALWLSAHAQSSSALIAMYNFDDMAMAQAIVAAAKAGKKQVIVGDYSNWFPQRMPENIARSQKTGEPLPQPTPAMNYIVANLGPNLELRILKGLGPIGINHDKFTVFTAADGSQLLQSGSFNYSLASQNSHWENVVFTNDPDRISFYSKFHAWIYRRARPYSSSLQPQDPVMDPSDPIPQDPSRTLNFHGVPFPKAMGTPGGTAESWLTRAVQTVKRTLDILMFAPYPTPSLSAAIRALLAKNIPVRLIADVGEVAGAGAELLPLMKNGLQLKTIAGPDVVLRGAPYTYASKMHEKVMVFDGAAPDALAKLGDSLNISENAFLHNFENVELWQSFHAAYMQAHFDLLWGLASAPTSAILAKMRAAAARHGGGSGPAAPSGPKRKPRRPAPAKPARPKKKPRR